MLTPPRLSRLKRRFLRSVAEETRFITSLEGLHMKSRSRSVRIGQRLQDRLCEMSFLGLLLAWEELLDSSMEEYLMYYPIPVPGMRVRIKVDNRQCAKDIILGEGKKYVDWFDPESVQERAELFFRAGEPYATVLGSISVHLKRMRTVRNVSVHRSRYATEKFNDMIRGIYGHGRRITPGRFLLDRPPPPLYPTINTIHYGTVFELFAGILSAASEQIVP